MSTGDAAAEELIECLSALVIDTTLRVAATLLVRLRLQLCVCELMHSFFFSSFQFVTFLAAAVECSHIFFEMFAISDDMIREEKSSTYQCLVDKHPTHMSVRLCRRHAHVLVLCAPNARGCS
jgi:hypothetical protein